MFAHIVGVALLELCRYSNLSLLDSRGTSERDLNDCYWFEGRARTLEEIFAAYSPIRKRIHEDQAKLWSDGNWWERPDARHLDNLSIILRGFNIVDAGTGLPECRRGWCGRIGRVG